MIRSNSTTEKLFRNAGLSEGMSVLELGCGPGEVTELLSELVGPAGYVVAVDKSDEMLATATTKLEENGKCNVRFISADVNNGPEYLNDTEHATFNAIVGRRILMYLTSPDQVLLRLLPWLQAGGLVVFEEVDSTVCPGHVAAMPAHVRAVSLLDKMLREEGVDRSIGFHLPAIFSKAGLRFERVWAEAIIEGQGDQYTIDELLNMLKPRLESTGVASASEIDLLIPQIAIEREPESIFLSSMRFCAKAVKVNGASVDA